MTEKLLTGTLSLNTTNQPTFRNNQDQTLCSFKMVESLIELLPKNIVTIRKKKLKVGVHVHVHVVLGERGGSVVEYRTPEREVRGLKPTVAVLCP